MREITEKEAAEFSRAEAIEALRSSPSASDRRMAELLAAGPDVSLAEENRVRSLKLRRAPLVKAVAQLVREIAAERIEARAEMAELAGGAL